MAPWIRVLEAYLVQALLRTPAFHRGVEKVARSVHRIRHGIPPEELGGTKIDAPSEPGFMKHFLDEVKGQIGAAEKQEAANAMSTAERAAKDGSVNVRGKQGDQNKVPHQEDDGADTVWQYTQNSAGQAPRAGFLQEYMDALREQVKNGKKGS